MSIQIENRQGITVVYLTGILNALTVPKIQPQLEKLVQSEQKFIIEMSQVEMLSSIGLWMLLGLQRQMKDQRGKLILAQLSTPARTSLEKVGFASILLSFETLEQGLDFLNN